MAGNVWITSDTHWGHKNIVLGETEWTKDKQEACRNFSSLEEMNNTIVTNINTSVKENDILYHCGDFVMGGIDNVLKFRKLIKCKNIHFILGNHDYHIRKNKIIKIDEGYMNIRDLFVECEDIIEKKIGKDKFFMCHYPVYSWHKQYNAIHVYGHTHKELHYDNRAICVCLDVHPEFRPYHIDEIRKIYYENIANTV